jgi:hypothetical protein
MIVEAAGEGHNDAVMVVALLLSLWLLRRSWIVAAVAAFSIAVLTKWAPVFFAPLYATYAWRRHLITSRTFSDAAAAAAAVTVTAYSGLWAGANTFAGLRSISGPRFVASVTGSLASVLAAHPMAHGLLRVCVWFTLAVTMMYAAAATRTWRDLVRGCAAVALTLVLLAAPLYWPWYVLMPITLLTLAGDWQTVVVLSATSRLVAPLEVLRLRGVVSTHTEVWLMTVVGLWLPLAYIASRRRIAWFRAC